jgi:hypothetical protein
MTTIIAFNSEMTEVTTLKKKQKDKHDAHQQKMDSNKGIFEELSIIYH